MIRIDMLFDEYKLKPKYNLKELIIDYASDKIDEAASKKGFNVEIDFNAMYKSKNITNIPEISKDNKYFLEAKREIEEYGYQVYNVYDITKDPDKETPTGIYIRWSTVEE